MKADNRSYTQAGVDVNAGYEAVNLMKKSVSKTFSKNVLSGLGGFGGLFELNLDGIQNPVMVSGTDGVGTKLKLAFHLDKHNTIGIDCVAMCVNDIICCGAKPLYFLDYIAIGKNIPHKIAEIVKGVSEGCIQAKCSLIGGETAEMPGFYNNGEYDLAGFGVGIVDKQKLLNPANVSKGDIIIGINSSGVHSNGYSLIRQIIKQKNLDINLYYNEFGKTLAEELLTPTKIYVDPIMEILKYVKVKSISHITGGGLYENIPRAISNSTSAKIYKDKINSLPIFEMLKKIGGIDDNNMFSTFNMGIGLCIIFSEQYVDTSLSIIRKLGYKADIIGEIIDGDKELIIC